MGKIGFVVVSHPDYINGGVEQVSRAAVLQLQQAGISLHTMEQPACNSWDAEAAGKELAAAGVDGVILFLGSWVECPVAMSLLREVEHLPVLMWGFPMMVMDGQTYSTGSYVSYAMFKGVLDRISFPFEGILGEIGDEKIALQILSFCKAATAYQRLKRSKAGLVGYTSMSIYTGTFDHLLMRTRIGPEIEQIDTYSLLNIAKKIGAEEKKKIIEELRQSTRISPRTSPESLEKIAGLYYALMELKEQKRLDAINVKCQYEFSKEYGMVMCVPLSLAADHGIVASCEGDILNTVSMMTLHFLSGQVVSYGDAISHVDNAVKLSPCGFMPFSMGEPGKQLIQPFMPDRGFSGVQTSFVMRPEKVTVLRLIEDIGSYHFLYFVGQGLPTELRDGYFPALDVQLSGDIQKLIEHYSGQHYAICYGDYSREIESLARILKIRAIRV